MCVGFGVWKKVNAFKSDFPDNTWIRTLTSPASLAYQWEYNRNPENESEHAQTILTGGRLCIGFCIETPGF